MNNDQSFNGRTAIITGAATGIGFEIAVQLATRGSNIVLNDIEPNALGMAVEEIKKMGGNCVPCEGDTGDIECIDNMINLSVVEYGQLDMTIANAGLSIFGNFMEFSEHEFEQLINVNLKGSFFLAQRSTKQMINQKSGGRILFMSSVTGHQYHPDLAAYGMSKAALEMLAKSLGVELAQEKITVNAIAPGATITDRNLKDPTYIDTWEKLTPTGKVNSTEDIARVALFLLSPKSSQITGQTIIVDGGWTSYSPAPD